MYASAAGEHQVKFGAQFDRVGNNVLRGESEQPRAPALEHRARAAIDSGTYGYYQVRSNGVDPKKGFITDGDIHTNNIGLFIQDSWTINNRLTVNAGRPHRA